MIYFSCPIFKKSAVLNHAFFTRQGGTSTGIYGSLNAGIGSDDDAEHVFENIKRIKQTLDVESLLTLYQIHSNHVIVADEHMSRIEGDALVTTIPNLAIGILTADCVPVLFADIKNKVIGAAHAGWKGALTGILENTINTMISEGADIKHITASIGPCIGQAHYEVGEEFRDRFLANDKTNKRFFKPSKKTEHFMFNISGYVKSRIEAHNITKIHVSAYDTYKEDELFFSYRRATHKNEVDYGRQMSAICLKVDEGSSVD